MNSLTCCLFTVKMSTLSLDSECLYRIRPIRYWPISLCFLCLVYQAVSDLCPYGWLENPKTSFCYYITSDSSQDVPLDSVRDRCKWMDSEMVTFNIKSKKTWLLEKLKTLSNEKSWWLGYFAGGNNVELPESSNVVSSILNSTSPGVRKGHCVYFIKYSHMFTTNCNQRMGYICKREKNLPMKCDIGNGWTYIEGSCLKYISTRASWENAKRFCEMRFDARMANIQTLEQRWYVWSHAKMRPSVSWNGISFNNKDNQFQWTDGSPVIKWWNDNTSAVSTNNSDTCGLIYGRNNITSAWTTGNCTDKGTFTCMKPSGVCPEGWNTIDDTCFKLFVEPILTWVQARDYCNQIGAQQKIQDEVLITARALANSLTDMWIGISDQTGNFTWTDGTVANFTFWTKDPHPRLKGNRRGYIRMAETTGRWRTYSEVIQRSFGCSMSRNSSNADVTSHSIYICEKGWDRSGQSCLYRAQDKKSWSDANSTCNNLQSQLLIINSDTHLGIFSDDMYWVSKESEDKIDLPYFNITWNNKDNVSCPLLQYTRTKEIKIQASNCSNTYEFYCEKPAVDSADYYLTNEYSDDCGMMWEKRPGTDLCYQFRQAKMTWPDALQHCIDQNSSLASITSSEEQNYIEGKLNDLHFLQFWVGASDRRELFNIQWEDGNPFLYSNWEQGKPEFRNVPNCIGINADSMKWNDYSCYLSIGFICKKKAISSQVTTTSPSSTPSVLPSNLYNGCPSGWHKYCGYCYQINTQDEHFDGAMVNCQNQNSTLASIHSKGENGFLWSLLLPDKIYWIGSIVQDRTGYIRWADFTQVDYTNLENTPSLSSRHFRDIVISIKQQTGKWIPMSTYDLTDGYICKKPTVIVSSPGVQQYSTGCMEEGYAYAEYCYTYYNTLTSWDEAQKFCRMRNGDLAVVSNSVTNDFLSSVFGDRNGSYFWIGLSVVKGKRNWVRQILPSEEFWERQFTGNNDGCASMNSTLQNWQLKNCSSLFGFVCETVRQGFTTQTVPTTTTTVTPTWQDCPSNWIYKGGFCYVVFESAMSWHQARYHCESLGGNLPSIHDESTNSFIAALLRIIRPMGSFWIGLHDTKIEKAFEWSDGSPLDFSNWFNSEPIDQYGLEDCVQTYTDGSWSDVNCNKDLQYVCSLKSGSPILPATIPTTPAQRCHNSDWVYHYGFCYFFSEEFKTWQEAETDCISRGGHLASVLSYDENSFLSTQALKAGTGAMWIGYNSLKSDSFVWSDGKPNGFKMFVDVDKGDCVSSNLYYAAWYTHQCDDELKYVCKHLKEFTFSTVPTTTQRIEKFCPAGFVGSGKIDKCYAVVDNEVLNWYDAIRACAKISAKLASINSDQEQDVVNTLASKQRTDIWIGMRGDISRETSFYWIDGSPVAYTKWARSFPLIRKYRFAPGQSRVMSCVVLNTGQPIATWENIGCDIRHYFLCQTPAKFRAATITEILTSSTTTEGIVNVQTSQDRVSSQLSITPNVNDISTLLSKDSGTTIANFTVSDPAAKSSSTTAKSIDVSTKSPNVDSFTDQFSDQPSTTVNISSSTSKDSFQFTPLAVTDNDQSSTLISDSVNVTSLRSDHKVSDTSLTTTDTALIVLGLLALIIGISFAVTRIIRYNRRRAQIPIRPVSKEGGFLNVLYSSIHEPDL